MLTNAHFQAGRAVRHALARAEGVHRGCPHLKALHGRLADLLEAFRADLPDDEYVALGGGTPKTPDDPA